MRGTLVLRSHLSAFLLHVSIYQSSPPPSFLHVFFKICVCELGVHARMGVRAGSEGHCHSQFCFAIMYVLGIELRPSGTAVSAFTH